MNMTQAQTSQFGASKQMDTSRRCHDDTVVNNISCYDHLHKTMGQKVANSHRLIEKLTNRQHSIEGSLQATRASLAALEKALMEKDAPLRLCQWRLEQREKRPLREQVRDPCETALEDELATLIETQNRLRDAIKRTRAAIHDLTDMLNEVKHDIEHKQHALGIDESCLRSTERSMHAVMERTPPPASARATRSPNSLSLAARHQVAIQESGGNEVRRQQNAEHLSRQASAKEDAAKALRDDNSRLIQRCESMAHDAVAKAEKRMQERVQENQQMRRRLENEMRETNNQIQHTKGTISDTLYQLKALDEPMDLTNQCGSWRQQRATKEHIVDPVSTAIHMHRNQTLAAQKELLHHHQEEKAHLKELLDRRDRLAEDMKDKTSSLHIDLNCLTHEGVRMDPTTTSPLSMRTPRLGRSAR